jgi:DMSO/TMAO reductase YedYZ molybdopterin-dependent catalytic subunit
LDAEHGFPLRLLIPGFYGTNCVKWLSRLHLADARADGPFTTLLYNDPDGAGTRPVWQVAPESVIVSPAPESCVGPRDVEIWGWAWADGGVAAVEVSVDGGRSWRAAELEPRSGWRWQKFHLSLDAGGEGETVLMSRAIDRQGKMQPASDWRNSVYAVKVSRRSSA